MRTVLWNMERARSMIKNNAVTGIEITPVDKMDHLEIENSEEEQRFTIKLTCRYNAIAFLSTSYKNNEHNKIRLFNSVQTALSTASKLHS